MSFSPDEINILRIIHLCGLVLLFLIFAFILSGCRHSKKIALLGVLAINYVLLPLFTGEKQKLISDEAMLAHFKTYRPEIETLLEEYRTNPEEWGSFDKAMEELQVMKEKSSVDRLSYKWDGWFENPYSLEAAKQFQADAMSGKWDFVRDKSPRAVFVAVSLKDARVFHIGKYGGKYVFKEYLHIPQVAKIEKGRLLQPISPTHPDDKRFIPVSESLDQIPDWLEPGQCILKPIDKHWYLSLCQSS